MGKKAALHNLGCKVNAYETEAMRQLLEQAGYEIVPFAPGADVYVINTCTVTNIADRKSRQMIHRAKKMNPEAVVVAAGCYVQTTETPHSSWRPRSGRSSRSSSSMFRSPLPPKVFRSPPGSRKRRIFPKKRKGRLRRRPCLYVLLYNTDFSDFNKNLRANPPISAPADPRFW